MEKINVTRSSMPEFSEYCEEIKELWESHWLTNMGVKHKQFEAMLKEACSDTAEEMFAEYYDVTDADDFSDEHKQKMEELFKKSGRKDKLRKLSKLTKYAACILLVFTIFSSLTILSVESVRNKFFHYFHHLSKMLSCSVAEFHIGQSDVAAIAGISVGS